MAWNIGEENDQAEMKQVNIQEVKDVLQHVLKTDIVPFLWGPPGIGKSTAVQQIADENNWDIIDLRLSLINPVDLRGLPVVDKENKKADWYKPGFLPSSRARKTGILFLDEINLAPLSVQAAAYQLILDKRVGEYKFPKSWRIVAAGNRHGIDKANVYKISAPLANRFIHFNVVEDWRVWKDWARANKLCSEVIDFVATRPALFLKMPQNGHKAFPSPRSWHFVSNLMQAYNYKNGQYIDENLESMIIGSVGEGAGREFCSFLQDYDLQKINDTVERFIETGQINMPEPTSERMGVIKLVYDAYRERKINEAKYMKFLSSLTEEEKATILAFEKQHEHQLKTKYDESA